MGNVEFVVEEEGDYVVENQHTETLNNEKKLIELLTDSLADQIFTELVLKINDL